jgi:hypothetical protein
MGNISCCAAAEPSRYRAILEGCRANGAKFLDAEFQPSKYSLIQDWQEQHPDVLEIVDEWDTYEWIRASEIPELNDHEGQLKVFAGQVEPNDIRQGALGDCYFLSVLSVTTEKPERIRKLFVSD